MNVTFYDDTDTTDWWNSSFDLCRNITLAAATETLTNFPVFINLTNTTHMDETSLRFINESCYNNGSELDFEVENFAVDNGEIWVQVDSITTSNRIISVYYNSTTAGSGEDQNGTWDNGYELVYHMDGLYDGTEDEILDSAGEDHNGEANCTNQTDGMVYYGQEYEGGDKNWTEFEHPTLTTNITIEQWILSDDSDAERFMGNN